MRHLYHGRVRRARMQRVPCGMRALRCGCAAMQRRRATYTTPHAANTLAGNTVKGCASHNAMQCNAKRSADSVARAGVRHWRGLHELPSGQCSAGGRRPQPKATCCFVSAPCPCPYRRDAHTCVGCATRAVRTRWCRCVRGTPTQPPAETRPRAGCHQSKRNCGQKLRCAGAQSGHSESIRIPALTLSRSGSAQQSTQRPIVTRDTHMPSASPLRAAEHCAAQERAAQKNP